jgi:hypothetical protein
MVRPRVTEGSKECEALRRTAARLRALEEQLEQQAITARRAGATWRQIGEALDIPARTAHLRFARLVEDSDVIDLRGDE